VILLIVNKIYRFHSVYCFYRYIVTKQMFIIVYNAFSPSFCTLSRYETVDSCKINILHKITLFTNGIVCICTIIACLLQSSESAAVEVLLALTAAILVPEK